MKLTPLGERALVKMVEGEQTTESGIVLPDTAKEKPQTAEVVEVGQFEEEGAKVEVGDVVVLRKFAGTEVDLDGEEHLIVKVEDILGVIERQEHQDQRQDRNDQQEEDKGLVEKVKDTLMGE